MSWRSVSASTAKHPLALVEGSTEKATLVTGLLVDMRERGIESMISVCRDHAGNVKRWRDRQMALGWCAAGMVEAGKQFRPVNSHLRLPTLRP